MAAQAGHIYNILLHGCFCGADPGRTVIVNIGLADVQGHIVSRILKVALNDDNIIGGNGTGAVQAVVANGPSFQLQIVLIIADLNNQGAVYDADRYGLAVTNQLDVVNAGLSVFQAPVRIVGSCVGIHCKGDTVAPHAAAVGLHHAGVDRSGQLGGKYPGRAVIVQVGGLDLQNGLIGGALPEAVDDQNIAGGGCEGVQAPAGGLQIVVSFAVLDQSAAAGDTDVGFHAVTDDAVSISSQRCELCAPVGHIFRAVGCHSGIHAVASCAVTVIAQIAGKDGVEDQVRAVYTDHSLFHNQDVAAGFVLKLALNDDLIAVYEGQNTAGNSPGCGLQIHFGSAVDNQSAGFGNAHAGGYAVTNQLNGISGNRLVLYRPIRIVGCLVSSVGNVDTTCTPAVGVVCQSGNSILRFQNRLGSGIYQSVSIDQDVGLGDVQDVAVVAISESAFHDQIVAVGQGNAVKL